MVFGSLVPTGTTLQRRALLSALEAIPGLHICGITDPQRLEDRVATLSFHLKDLHLRKVAGHLAKKGIYVWDVNYYALNIIERLGVEDRAGRV